MAREVNPVFELRPKLGGMMNWARQASRPELSSIRAIERKTGIPRTTLTNNIDDSTMSSANETTLGREFGFLPSWPEWRDPKGLTLGARRRDTANAFIKRFLAHKSEAECLTIEPELTADHVDPRFADFNFALTGSFELSPDNREIPLALSVFFERRGWSFSLEGTPDALTVGLKEVDLYLIPDRKNKTRKTARIRTFPVSCRDDTEGNFEGTPEGLQPWWVFTVAKNNELWLAGRILRNDMQACGCSGFEPGDKIDALMTARVDTCFAKVTGETFETMSEEKKAFLRHLGKVSLLNGTEATLCKQVLVVVERERP